MADIAILIAETRAGLDAVAEAGELTLLEGTAKKFSSLTTFSSPGLTTAGHIDTNRGGWFALAKFK